MAELRNLKQTHSYLLGLKDYKGIVCWSLGQADRRRRRRIEHFIAAKVDHKVIRRKEYN